MALKAHWTCDTTADKSGNGYDLTLTNGVTTGASGAKAGTGSAWTFDGVNDYAVHAASVLGNSPAAFTLMGWVKAAAAASKACFSLGNSATTNPYVLIRSDSGTPSTLVFVTANDAATFWAGAIGTALDNTWHHVAVTFAGGTLTPYLDGVAGTPVTGKTLAGTTLNQTGLGALVRSTVSQYLPGSLDDWRVYDTALTAAQVAHAVASASAPYRVFASPVIR